MDINIEQQEAKQSSGFISNLPGMLRIAGAGALVIATLTFLVQSLDFDSPINRILNFAYLLLAVFGLGFFCKIVVQEIKSAKIGMSLGVGMVPVIVLQLSAVLYATIASLTRTYPKYLAYNGFEDSIQIYVAGIGIFVFAGLTMLAIKTLSEFGNKSFSKFYLLGLFTLLMPFRGNLSALILAGIVLLVCVWQERIHFQKNPEYQTKEAAYLRFMLFVPSLILLLRNLVLYAQGTLSLSLVFGALAVIFGLVTSSIKPEYYVRSKFVAICCTFIAWILLVAELDQTFLVDYRFYVAFLPAVVYFLNLKVRFPRGELTFNFLANISFILMLVTQQSINGGMLDTSLSIALSILGIAYAWTVKDRLSLFVTSTSLFVLLASYWDLVLDLYKLNPWMFMGFAGVLTILVASYLEKNLDKVKEVFSKFKK